MSSTYETAIEIHPFRVDIPEEDLVDLRRRIAATRWPERETVDDTSQGVRLATIRELARYWGSDYDLRRFGARLNALSQFITEIDGLDIHFIAFTSLRRLADVGGVYDFSAPPTSCVGQLRDHGG
jgi:hypothetical protein